MDCLSSFSSIHHSFVDVTCERIRSCRAALCRHSPLGMVSEMTPSCHFLLPMFYSRCCCRWFLLLLSRWHLSAALNEAKWPSSSRFWTLGINQSSTFMSHTHSSAGTANTIPSEDTWVFLLVFFPSSAELGKFGHRKPVWILFSINPLKFSVWSGACH